MLVKKLSEIDDEGNYVIDLVLVVLDASSKDMGTAKLCVPFKIQKFHNLHTPYLVFLIEFL